MTPDSVTAVVLSKVAVQPILPVGVKVVNSLQSFSTISELHQARLNAIALVQTPWFFYLDDDDELPPNIDWVLEEALKMAEDRKSKLVYTDEIVCVNGEWRPSTKQEYDQSWHAKSPNFIHHLALVNTAAALDAVNILPKGNYWTEMLLYFQVAKQGASWLRHYGYIWNYKETGAHTWPDVHEAQRNSASWCAANLS